MRILMLNYEYPPLGAGAGVITQNISEGLAKLGNEVTVLTTCLPATAFPDLRYGAGWQAGFNDEEEIKTVNLKIIRLKSKRKYTYKSNPVEMLSWIKKSKIFLKEYCQSEIFDICFANFALPGGEVAYYLKKRFDIPYVIISHGHDIPWFYPKQMFFYHLLTYFRIKRICRQSEINFIQTNEMKLNIDKFLGKKYHKKNIIIPNGLDFQSFNNLESLDDRSKKSTLSSDPPAPPAKTQWRAGRVALSNAKVPLYNGDRDRAKKFKIIFVGRLVKQKDPFTFLKAIKLYKEKNSTFAKATADENDFIVHILGDGPLRKKMEDFVNKNDLRTKVEFLGWVSKDKVIEAYQSANLHIAPSLSEGMSVAVLESLACGQYVITTPVSKNPELIQEYVNGELVNIGDYEELSNKIQTYYKEKFLKQYNVPIDFINSFRMKYDWSSIVREYDLILNDLIKMTKY